MSWRVNVVETDVLGAIAFHAECQHCTYKSKRIDGERGRKIAEDRAKEHGTLHAEAESTDFYTSRRAKRELSKAT